MIENISIIIPAFNESEGIASVLTDILAELKKIKVTGEVIVVNDASTDNTLEIIEKLAQSNDQLKIITNISNKGYGGSLKVGIKLAKNEIIVIIDADGTYPIKYLDKLLSEMDSADMVVGARTGDNVAINWLRRPAKAFLRQLASFLTETNIPDINSGFRAFRKDLALKYLGLLPNKFSFTTTITLALLSDGYDVKYIPIDYHPRKGVSKIKPFDAWGFFILTIKSIFYFNPLKVVLPVSMLIGMLGVFVLIYDIFVISDVGDTALVLLLGAMQIFFFGLLADLISRWRK